MAEKYIIKHFDELNTQELYDFLRLRNEVFVVEQKCAYSELDNKDQQSFHFLHYINDDLAAYSRLLPAGLSYFEIAIGRVVTSPKHRGKGLGQKLMSASIEGCYEKFGKLPIRIGAQFHLIKFYRSLGFVEEGEPYNEDGIMHIEMVKLP